MPGDIPSPPRKNRAFYDEVNQIYKQLFTLDDKIQDYGVQVEHCKELNDISQVIIDLNLNDMTDMLIDSRTAFNDYWENYGYDYDNFKQLFDCSCDILACYLHPNVF